MASTQPIEKLSSKSDFEVPPAHHEGDWSVSTSAGPGDTRLTFLWKYQLSPGSVSMWPVGAYMCHGGRLGWSGTSGLGKIRGTSTQ